MINARNLQVFACVKKSLNFATLSGATLTFTYFDEIFKREQTLPTSATFAGTLPNKRTNSFLKSPKKENEIISNDFQLSEKHGSFIRKQPNPLMRRLMCHTQVMYQM